MKSYTDLEQSRKLAEILPLESADMFYVYDRHLDKFYGDTPYVCYRVLNIDVDIPCWSLAALLGILPEPDLVQNSEGTWLLRSWVNAYPWSVGSYSNPIDACVEMILKLHKLNLL